MNIPPILRLGRRPPQPPQRTGDGRLSDTEETQARAEALFRTIARRFVVGHGEANLRADFHVGRRVDIRGVGPLFEMDGSGSNDKKVLRSRNGVKIALDDQDGQEQIILGTPGGQTLTMKDGPGTAEVVDSNGNSIELRISGITIIAAATVTVNASIVKVSAGMVRVDAGLAQISGVVMADTVICSNVVAATCTPGAGNIW